MGSSELTSGHQLDEAEVPASLIKKELDERLTEEQRRKKQVISHCCPDTALVCALITLLS